MKYEDRENLDKLLTQMELKHTENAIKRMDENPIVKMILPFIAEHFGIEAKDVRVKTRRRYIVEIRYIGMYLVKKYTKYSLAMIGMYFGDFDHATVIHARKTIEDLMETQKHIRESVEKFDLMVKKLDLTITKNLIFRELVNMQPIEERGEWITRYKKAI